MESHRVCDASAASRNLSTESLRVCGEDLGDGRALSAESARNREVDGTACPYLSAERLRGKDCRHLSTESLRQWAVDGTGLLLSTEPLRDGAAYLSTEPSRDGVCSEACWSVSAESRDCNACAVWEELLAISVDSFGRDLRGVDALGPMLELHQCVRTVRD